MRISLRMLMIANALVAIGIAIPIQLGHMRNREAALLAEIGWNSPITGTYRKDADQFAEEYDRSRCLDIYNKYKYRTDWQGNRIASAAMFHLARMKTRVGLQLCRENMGSTFRSRMECAVKGVLIYFGLSDDIHFTQNCGAWFSDGTSGLRWWTEFPPARSAGPSSEQDRDSP